MKEKSGRLLSLDVLRGFDMSFIMGGEVVLICLASLFPGLKFLGEEMGHSQWDGFTFYDLIFPLFLFLSGISFPFSMAKQLSVGKSKESISLKVLKRGLILVLLGIVYNGLLQFDFDTLRCASVLGRIGLAWMFASLLYVWLKRKWLLLLSALILLGYWALLAFVVAPDAPDGASSFSMEGSIAGYLDRCLLPGALHNEIHDPEGILSTLPAIVTALLGIFTGEFVRSKRIENEYQKVAAMIGAAIVLLSLGYLWNIVFPINKNLWSSSFVCCAGGWSLLLFALFYLIVDVVGWSKWALPFRVIGMNSITIYLAQEFLDFSKPVDTLFGGALKSLPEDYYVLGWWCCYMLVCWCFLYFLYRKKVFLKV
jgi:predicted acyltransferase